MLISSGLPLDVNHAQIEDNEIHVMQLQVPCLVTPRDVYMYTFNICKFKDFHVSLSYPTFYQLTYYISTCAIKE